MTTARVFNASPVAHDGRSKTERYGWSDLGAKGIACDLPKEALQPAPEYQRESSAPKVAELTKRLFWAAFGVITVVDRGGKYYIADGAHRWMATLRRPEITTLPCLLFRFSSIEDEARTFLALNILRRPLTAVERHSGEVCAGELVPGQVASKLKAAGLAVSKTAHRPGQIKCLEACKTLEAQNPDRFTRAINTAAELSLAASIPVNEKLVKGLAYIDQRVDGGILGTRMAARLRSVGAEVLLSEAKRMAYARGKGGPKVEAEGMLEAINKGLRTKFTFTQESTA